MAKFTVTYKCRNVNTKRILQRLVATVVETAEQLVYVRSLLGAKTKMHDFSNLVEYLELYFEELLKEKAISTFDVIGDLRNNDQTEMNEGLLKLLVKFKQYNCLNTTEVEFWIAGN